MTPFEWMITSMGGIMSMVGVSGLFAILRYIHFEARRVQGVEDRLVNLETDRKELKTALEGVSGAMKELSTQSAKNGININVLNEKMDRGEQAHESIKDSITNIEKRLTANEVRLDERTARRTSTRRKSA